MHYWRCIYSIAPSDLTFSFFFNPRGRQTLAKLSPQPHWLGKQTGDVTRQASGPSLYMSAQGPTFMRNCKHNPTQPRKWFLGLLPGASGSPDVLNNAIFWNCRDMANNALAAKGHTF